jgi:hypothetical protein
MTTPPNGSSEAAERGRIYKIEKFYALKSPDDVMTWIESNQGPVHIGIEWLSSMDGTEEFVSSYSGRSGGGHSVFLAGYKTVRGTRCPRLYNSWSKRWRKDGTAVISRQALDAMFRRQFTVMVGVNGADGIVPPRYDYLSKPVTR